MAGARGKDCQQNDTALEGARDARRNLARPHHLNRLAAMPHWKRVPGQIERGGRKAKQLRVLDMQNLTQSGF